VKCARCGHQWRMLPVEPEELTEPFEFDSDPPAPSPAETQPSATGFAENAARYGYTASEAEQTGSSWEVRRGNLAAALASMSESFGENTDPENGELDIAATQQWSADPGDFQATTSQAMETDDDVFHQSEPNDAFDQLGTGPDVDYLGVARTDIRRISHETAEPATGDVDPEFSVREVLRAVIDAPEKGAGEEDRYGPEGTESAIAGPVFTDSDMEEPAADPSRDWVAKAPTTTDYDSAAGVAENNSDISQKAFSDRWQNFADIAAERDPQGEAAEPTPAPQGPEDPEKFENDIAGIFRQELQAKRSFGPAPRAKSSGDSFTDYDVESGHGPGTADDAYMPNSPLDADAAALQAALEGSLRERHAEESRSGSGGLALAAAWAVFLSVLSGVSLAFINFREDIVVALPGMGALYRTVGLGVQTQQIDFGPVNYRWTVADGKPMIEVTGQIINLTDREIPVPRVLINVRDKESGDPVKATATIRSDPLAAREAADFTLEFISPSKSVNQIELAFAETTD
jgi:hypothetical protein